MKWRCPQGTQLFLVLRHKDILRLSKLLTTKKCHAVHCVLAKTASAITVSCSPWNYQLCEESVIISSSRCDEVDVILLFCIDFCSLLPWAHSTSIYDTVLQSTAVLMSRPQCTWMTFHMVQHRSFCRDLWVTVNTTASMISQYNRIDNASSCYE